MLRQFAILIFALAAPTKAADQKPLPASRQKFLLIALAASSLAFAVQPASAQAPRTWVSGVGDDANPCSRTAPCKTFAGAISKTATGGEISVLDPGGFGAVTITKAITIDGGGGQVASVLASGTNGIVVSAGAGDTVTLRNLRINGVVGSPSGGGLNGVQFLSGAALHIENCTIFGFAQTAININVNTASVVRVFVTDTVVSKSAGGIAARNAGAGNVFVSMHRTTIAQNSGVGLKADGGGGAGSIFGAVSDSLITGNGTGLSALSGPAGSSGVQITRSSVASNLTTGALSDGSAGPGHPPIIIFSNTLITLNTPGLSTAGGGRIVSYKNNSVDGNFPDGVFTSTLTPE
jgi:hypothetical protein